MKQCKWIILVLLYLRSMHHGPVTNHRYQVELNACLKKGLCQSELPFLIINIFVHVAPQKDQIGVENNLDSLVSQVGKQIANGKLD